MQPNRFRPTDYDSHGLQLYMAVWSFVYFMCLFPQVSSLSPGVVYVAHLPRTLGEKELKIYFQQFGHILRLRLSRSKKVRHHCLLFLLRCGISPHHLCSQLFKFENLLHSPSKGFHAHSLSLLFLFDTRANGDGGTYSI